MRISSVVGVTSLAIGIGLVTWVVLLPDDPASIEAVPGVSQSPNRERAAKPVKLDEAATSHKASAYKVETVEVFDGHVIEGQLEADQFGRLLISLDLRVLLDFFIATYQDLGVAGVREKFSQYANQILTDPAYSEAMRAYDQYALYLQNVQDIMQRLSLEGSDIAFMTMQQDTANQQAYFQRIRDNLDELTQLRRVYFNTAEHEAFFSFEEIYSRYSVERMALMANESLSELERQAAIERLQAMLPPEIREFEEHSQRDYELFEQTEALRARGASEAEVQALRERYVGKEVADQMAEFEVQERAWNQRYERYAEEVDALMSISGLSSIEKEQQVELLRTRHFTAQELEEVLARDEFRDSLQED